jgi:hypothetical protein
MGHVMPRVRARAIGLGLLEAGTARGADDQEGVALLWEERAGELDAGRRHALGLRHEAVNAMDSGASFGDVVRWLVEERGEGVREAVLLGERVFRGSDGDGGGLGRERVYLESFVRVRAWLEGHPDDEVILGSGQVALEDVAVLGPLVGERATEQHYVTIGTAPRGTTG